ncbi:MAG: hypothetical protein IJ777_04190 [Clostridia bacterium]|nr:hypothetical protein [Clostridia bacterium]
MIILNRKRLVVAMSLIIISVFAFTFQIADHQQTVQTVTLPVSNKVIVLDAGHGKPDERSTI